MDLKPYLFLCIYNTCQHLTGFSSLNLVSLPFESSWSNRLSAAKWDTKTKFKKLKNMLPIAEI
jgi:hypothetical protein